MNYDEGKPFANEHERRTADRIQSALDELHTRRKHFQDRRALGDVSERDKLLFGAAILSVFDEIRPFRHRVAERWTDPDHLTRPLDELPDRMQMHERERTTRRGAQYRVESELVLPAGPTELLRASYELDDLAHELGFEPGVEEREQLVDDEHILQV